MESYHFVFPEMLSLTAKPYPRGHPDETLLNLRTPLYSYGWIIPQSEILRYVKKALAHQTELKIKSTNVEGVCRAGFISPRWNEMEFNSKVRRCLRGFYEKGAHCLRFEM
ncbi:hypothetical protein CPB83DRAFT_855842 [Crepidotus variabilis]|uniref:Uncharacterized protein n=1 Tax=Crepidotus variabilis TaxID=179855 RepID=A0A9P6EF09_9AGAR|nr:hypothetical protein CPB83DRAFT_855842 [Crepidotus variabilis]